MKKENPKKAAILMSNFHGVDKALEINSNAINIAEKINDKRAVEVLKKVQIELIKIEQI